jgi:dihydropteroate synthase
VGRATRTDRFWRVLEGARARRGVALMGICNVTPDSFSDGGRHFSPADAQARIRALLDEGADFIDIGGESTRPGAASVPATEQLARVLGAIAYATELGACVSIDTTNPEVAIQSLEAGACIVNDVSCLRDEELASVCASCEAPLVLMHSREPMSELQGFSAYPDDAYGDVVGDVITEWSAAAERAASRGLARRSLVMDPGLGFAKNGRQSRALLGATGTIVETVGVPVCVGASRKSFLVASEAPSKRAKPEDRVGASVAAAVFAARQGAAILRVHDVRATAQAIDLDRALSGDRERRRREGEAS